jgi:hypothetical protein
VGEPFSIDVTGRVVNQVRLRIANRSAADRAYRVEVRGVDTAAVIVPVNPLPVGRGKTETTSFFVALPRHAFASGEPEIEVHISDGSGFDRSFGWRLIGPARHTAGGGS